MKKKKLRIIKAKIFDASPKHPKIIAENIFKEGLILDLEQPITVSDLYLLIPKLIAEEMTLTSLYYAIEDTQVIFTDNYRGFNRQQEEEDRTPLEFKKLIRLELEFLMRGNRNFTLDQWRIFWKLQSLY
jgi:hypothetical protein